MPAKRLKYYAEEETRWQRMKIPLCRMEALVAVDLLSQHFKVELPVLRFTNGRRNSSANSERITLEMDWATWLVLAHEFAHTWHMQLFRRWGISITRYHGADHHWMTDRVLQHIESKGWHEGKLKELDRLSLEELAEIF